MDILISFVNDYFLTRSVVDFKKTTLISSQWAQMCSNPSNTHWHSSSSKSEYVLVRKEENWIIYRYSDHWGRVNNSIRTLNGQSQNGPFVIGFATLKDFKFL